MLPLRELRTYVSALSVLPIAVMIANPVVLASFVSYLSSIAFFSAFGLIAVYLLLKQIGFIKSLGPNQQVFFESLLLVLPIIIPMFTVLTTGNPVDFIAAFLAYLVIGTVVSLSRVVIGSGVGAFGKVLYFFFAYMMALMVYAGCVAGQITGETFSLLLAFDQIAGIATYLGYEGHPIELPLIEYVRLGMAFAIPGITFSALAAQVRLSEVRDNPGGESKMVSSLRSSVALLTLGSTLLLIPVYLVSIAIYNFAPYLVTIIPPVLVLGFLLLSLYFVERDD
ncbi:MAG: hypothetical protein CMO19_00755 [Thaumarchaeota archaeon]|nr:hypothetical protein [Nitrososphaerota archaeon]|tara:strand:- start:2845 stop:3687 length:843 start_codon:yes stop_codon:yes gene_type:complete